MSSPVEVLQDYGNNVSLDPQMVFVQLPRKLVPNGVNMFELAATSDGNVGFVLTNESEEFIDARNKFEALFYAGLAAAVEQGSPRMEKKTELMPENTVTPVMSPLELPNKASWMDEEELEEKADYMEVVKKTKVKSKATKVVKDKVETEDEEVVEAIKMVEALIVSEKEENNEPFEYYGTKSVCRHCGDPFYINDFKKMEYLKKGWNMPNHCKNCTQERHELRNENNKNKKKFL